MEDEDEEVCHIYPAEDAPSLMKCAMNAIMNHITELEHELQYLPAKLKMSLFNLMSKRGLVSDSNLGFLLHRELLELDLTESSVTDASLLQIEKCKYLQKLNLNSMKKNRSTISSEILDELLTKLVYIRVLYLRRCTQIDDRPICTVSMGCSQYLTELNLSGCSLVTDVGVVALAKHALVLKCLNLSRTQVTDYGLISLADGVCAKILTELQLSYCKGVTDEGIDAVSNNCPKLSILIFHGCPLISSEVAAMSLQTNSNVPMKMVTWTIF